MQSVKKSNKLILVMGNVGTGKSTFIDSLNKRPNRTFLKSDNFITPEEQASVIEKNLRNGKDVIFEGVYTHKNKRLELINYLNLFFPECRIICFDFGSGDDNSLKRRAAGDKSQSYEQWERIHIRNKFDYEIHKPLKSEGFVKLIRKYQL